MYTTASRAASNPFIASGVSRNGRAVLTRLRAGRKRGTCDTGFGVSEVENFGRKLKFEADQAHLLGLVDVCLNRVLQGHNLVYPRRAGENTFFVHEGPRRKPLQGHNLVCPRRAGENTFFIHEGPRRTPLQGHYLGCPRRAAEGREENLCKVIIWSVREGRGRKSAATPWPAVDTVTPRPGAACRSPRRRPSRRWCGPV